MECNKISILLSGSAGQGLNTVEKILAFTFNEAGYYVFATKEYMSRVRGGNNSTQIVISVEPVDYYSTKTDILFLLNQNSLQRHIDLLSEDTLIIGDINSFNEDTKNFKTIKLNIKSFADKLGKQVYENSIICGILCGAIGVDFQYLEKNIKKEFENKPNEIEKNIEAALYGYSLRDIIKFRCSILKPKKTEKRLNLLNGTIAVANGCMDGVCNFISSYPMSPSTGVFTELSRNSKKRGIIIDQAEDEIAAINSSIAAWYAGARAMVSTSGGGFALMCEGISLAAMTETPIVVHLGQRPGPATGLPTRTEQADLNLVLYAGHGEFPRIIYAPGNIEQAYYLSAKAFDIADKFQIPVFILTDQYLLDTFYQSEFEKYTPNTYIVKTDENYKRYKLTDNGISPRGIPGWGDGFIRVDSDEHDEMGHITESKQIRKLMVEKRNKKIEEIVKDSIEPEFIGDLDYENLVICWGSTRNNVLKAISEIKKPKTAVLHFSQVFPIKKDVQKYLDKARRIIFIEQNFSMQFYNVFKLNFDEIKNPILIKKYDGHAMSIEFVIENLKNILEK